MIRSALVVLIAASWAMAQEAERGLDLSVSIGATALASPTLPDGGGLATGGFRALLSPTWKLSSHWTIAGVVQIRSRPYFFEDLEEPGYGLKSDVLQLSIGYSRFWTNGSILVRAGELPSSFGSFLVRYSEMDNPVIDAPLAYGYYYRPVTSLGLTGAQVDVTSGRVDFRAQLASSSPANRRSLWAHDQYANWTAGAGYTIIQGFRVGVSAFRGPYLDRDSPFFFRGESKPKQLPATAYGTDVSGAHGHTTVNGEWQRFIFTYHAIPTFIEHTGYGEIKQTIHPRWFVAGRAGYMRTNFSATQAYEGAVGFRPGAHQLFKAGYQLQRNGRSGQLDHILALQFVSTIHPLVWSGR